MVVWEKDLGEDELLDEAEQGGFRTAKSIVRIVTRNGNSLLRHV